MRAGLGSGNDFLEMGMVLAEDLHSHLFTLGTHGSIIKDHEKDWSDAMRERRGDAVRKTR